LPNASAAVRRLSAALALAACALLAPGCSDACLQLAQQYCSCYVDQATQQACNQRAKDNEQYFAVGKDDAAYCQKQLDSNACDCNQLNSAKGRAGCGIAWTPADGGTP
jgi:hypothetical protein